MPQFIMINPLLQEPLKKYFNSLHIKSLDVQKKHKVPKLRGLSSLLSKIEPRRKEHGLFITKPVSESSLRLFFEKFGKIQQIRVLKRYSFVIFDVSADLSGIVNKSYQIEAVTVQVYPISGYKPDFIPNRMKNRANLYYKKLNKY